jgi:two-component system, chemotaxis family, CheB/CheR fusion protein
MQSINEELQTVNVELNSKNEMLARLNSDLQNLLESTQIATLFLDSSLHVRGFTPAINDLFHLREGDQGRPITEITARIPYPQLKQDVKQVLRTLAMAERVLHGGVDGAVYLLRMRPYRTTDNVIDGVVLTFIDITERQQHEYERGRLAAIVESSQDAIIGHASDGTISSWNRGAEQMLGYAASRIIGKSLAVLLPDDAQDVMPRLLAACEGKASSEPAEMAWVRHDGTPVQVSVRSSPVLDPAGAIVGGSTIARDLTERNRSARLLHESERNLAALIEQTTVGVAQTDLDGRYELVNPCFCEIVGRNADELREKRFQDLTHPEDLAQNEDLFRRLTTTGESFNLDKRYVRPDGTVVWVSNYVSLITDDQGRPSHAVAIVLDVTQRKLAAQHRELLLGELNHRVKNTLATVQAITRQTLASAHDLASFRDAFMSRLQSLSNTHDLLAKDAWRSVDLREVVEAELAPYAATGRPAPHIVGEALLLNPKTALALSLALHELATNAGKYGALSTLRGRISVAWETIARDGQRWLELRWSESDGPAVHAPERSGFGSRLVTEGIPYELGGEVELDFAVTGVVCTMHVPLPQTAA